MISACKGMVFNVYKVSTLSHAVTILSLKAENRCVSVSLRLSEQTE